MFLALLDEACKPSVAHMLKMVMRFHVVTPIFRVVRLKVPATGQGRLATTTTQTMQQREGVICLV